jgi:hypothetical protein
VGFFLREYFHDVPNAGLSAEACCKQQPASNVCFGLSWALLEVSGAILGLSGALLGLSEALFGFSGLLLGLSWANEETKR